MRAQMKDSVNDIGGEYVMFNKILNPKEFVFMPLLNAADEYDSYNKSYSILAYLFDIDYYRESDMKNYSMRAIYFVDNGKVYNEKDFLKNSYYQIIMKKIDSYNNMVPPDMQTFPPISFITENRGFGANANKN